MNEKKKDELREDAAIAVINFLLENGACDNCCSVCCNNIDYDSAAVGIEVPDDDLPHCIPFEFLGNTACREGMLLHFRTIAEKNNKIKKQLAGDSKARKLKSSRWFSVRPASRKRGGYSRSYFNIDD